MASTSSAKPRAPLSGDGVRDELVYQTERVRVFRRGSPNGRAPLLYQQPLGPDAAKRLHHELAILARLSGVEGVPQLAKAPPSLESPELITLEPAAGVPLAQVPDTRSPNWRFLLQWAQGLARIVAAVHGRGVVHRHISPATILIAGAEREPRLAHFDRASTFAEERPSFTHHREIAGSLPYLAPEQTGRTGWAVDQRADLYALGATLYELVSGQPPFANRDPLALIHDLLVRVPTPLSALNPAVPAGLSEIVQRLLEKEPDRRYQSAEGLTHDLARLDERLARGEQGTFPLGERDFPLRLAPPARLVGREAEIGALQRAFDKACHGESRGVLLSGAPGVGKTALSDELRPIVTARGGWFVSGKYDQHREDLASDAVNQALRALGRLLLAEPEAELGALRQRIRAALGPNAGLIASLLPEFALLLQVPPEVIGGDPLKGEGRLIQAGIDLLGAIASPALPLVMVLDDLQWAGPTPIHYFDALLMDQRLHGLLVVGVYREAEVDAAHPLSVMLSRWERLGVLPLRLRLGELPPADLSVLLAEMLRLESDPAAKLADALGARTRGNPYDTVELVNALRRDGVLVPGDQGFAWNDATIRRYVGQGDVVDLLSARIERLPAEARALLEIMASLGGELELGLLRVASGLSAVQLQEQLAPALEDGLVVFDQDGEVAARFRHDRVQQAAYGRLPPATRQSLHLTLARRLAVVPELAAIAAEQYLLAVAALVDPVERQRAASLFRSAAASLRLTSYQRAERFLAAALELLRDLEGDAPLRSALAIERHAALCSLGRFAEADDLYRSLEERVSDPAQLAEAACLQVSSLTNRGRLADGLALGLALLGRLGLAVPTREQLGVEIERGHEALRRWAETASVADDVPRPDIHEPRLVARAKLSNRTMVAAFFCDPAMMAWLLFACHRMWVEHGPMAGLVGPLSTAPFVTVGRPAGYRTGCNTVRHALAVSEARGYEPESSQARLLFSSTAAPWLAPLEESVRQAHRAREGLVLGGDLQMAAFTFSPAVLGLLDCGQTIDSYAAEVEAALAFAARTGDDQSAAVFAAQRQLVQALRGQTDRAGDFADATFEPGAYAAAHGANPAVLSHFCVARALSATLFGDATELIAQAAAAMSLMPYIQANYSAALSYFLQALASAQRLRTAAPPERGPLLAELDRCRDWLAQRAAEAPFNFLHLLKLVEAERAWVLDDRWSAALAFDAALTEVETRTRPWHHALIAERAALFHLTHGTLQTGRTLLREARRLYAAWGASGKVRELERTHALLRAESAPELIAQPSPSGDVSADAIDMLAILRASQTLSSETKLDQLETRVVELLGSITGAATVHLVLWREETQRWFLSEAAGAGALSLSLEEAGVRGLLPLSPFRYAERTRQPLLVEDAVRDARFARDPYFAGLERCSLLVVPILSQGVARAVLVLENRLSRGAFSAQRLDAVTLIAGQLAVSLDNALLYASLEHKVAERTAELEDIHKRLLVASHQSGMAEIATNVLHNVGNVLNSVNVSATLVTDTLKSSRISGLAKVVALLREHERELGTFLQDDPRGKQLPNYLAQLYERLLADRDAGLKELGFLRQNIDHIKEIVAMQQTFASASGIKQDVALRELLEESLHVNRSALVSHAIAVQLDCQALPLMHVDKRKLLQILLNLVSNAVHACADSGRADKRMTLRLARRDDDQAGLVQVSVIDNGVGIPPENLTRIFQHGFTTRRSGHGFGLHSAALAAKELGGKLRVHSDGVGCGATFTLELPCEALVSSD